MVQSGVIWKASLTSTVFVAIFRASTSTTSRFRGWAAAAVALASGAAALAAAGRLNELDATDATAPGLNATAAAAP